MVALGCENIRPYSNMTELFTIPATEPSALDKARKRFADAKAQYELEDNAEPCEIPLPTQETTRKYREAEHLLAVLEAREVRARGGKV